MNNQNVTNDIKASNEDLAILKKHFSQCFDKNGKFQIEKFRKNLSENEIDFSTESYGLEWLGKSYARLLASDPATTLLKEDEKHNQKEENKNSENLLIKGDNLEVLKHLANAYHEKIKMIYIAPPYNTGSDGFVYQDDRKFTVQELQQLAGIEEEKAKRILEFTQSKSNSHSAWLTFMYPRLYIAKQLLSEDGLIFISIDDSEVAQLRLLLDEIFGEENFVEQFIIRSNPRGNQAKKHTASVHEYVLLYTKDISKINPLGYPINEEIFDKVDEEGYKYREIGLRKRGAGSRRVDAPNQYFPIYYYPTTKEISIIKNENQRYIEILPKLEDGTDGRWRWSKETVENEIDCLLAREVRRNGNMVYDIFEKNYYEDDKISKIKSIFYEKEVNYENGTEEVKKMFDEKVFNYPKPSLLIKKIIYLIPDKDSIIFDFFAGSGTTGDAVMQLNAEDGGNRKYILVQLPEQIDPKKNKTAYDFVKNKLKAEPTIYEITKERLNRATNKVKNETIPVSIKAKEKEIKELEGKLDVEEKEDEIKQLKAEIKALKEQDLGFKIYHTMPIWEDYDFEADELNDQTKLFDENKLTEDDIKAPLVTWKTYDGTPLSQDLLKIDLSGYSAHYGNGKLYLMDKGFTTDSLKALLTNIDSDETFTPAAIIAFGYHFESKHLREISENVRSYANKKGIDIDFITRY